MHRAPLRALPRAALLLGGALALFAALSAAPLQAQPAPSAKPADAKPADAKPADAKPADAKPADPKPEGRVSRPVATRAEPRDISAREYEERMRKYIRSGDSNITIYQVTQELLDDLLADIRDLRLDQASPLAIRGVGLSPNLSPLFGQWVEAELTARLVQSSGITVRHCASCQALKTDVEGGEWVLKLGWTTQDDMRAAADALGVAAFMDAFVSFVPGANQVMLTVRVYSAATGAVLWAESYSSDASTAAVLRSGDRVVTREEAYKELVRRVEQRPYYGYTIYFGGGMIPFAGAAGNIDFNTLGIRFYEKFGEDQRTLFGIFAESALNIFSNPLMGAFFGGVMQHRINRPNLNDIQIWAGGALEFFIAGLQGNTLAFEGNLDLIMQFRLGIGASLFYAIPVQFGSADIGGVGYKFRFTFNF